MELTTRHSLRRWALVFFGLWLGLFLLGGPANPLISQARAQDESPPASQPQPPEKKNIISHMLSSLGLLYIIIFTSISIVLVAMAVLLAMDLRMGAAIPPGFVEDFTDTVNKRRFKEAYELAKNDGSFLGKVMTSGMQRLQYGIEDAREAAFNMVESIRSSKDQLVSYFATIGTLGPMLGLVGTVYGMIRAFMRLGSAASPPVGELAGDISHALVVTLVGVALAVPAIFCHTFFRNRLTRVTMDVQNVADDLLTQMYHNSKKPGDPAPADGRPAAAPAATGAVKPK
jgi:biopolymer transport protein ExbB